jgi:hypothetical protein
MFRKRSSLCKSPTEMLGRERDETARLLRYLLLVAVTRGLTTRDIFPPLRALILVEVDTVAHATRVAG